MFTELSSKREKTLKLSGYLKLEEKRPIPETALSFNGYVYYVPNELYMSPVKLFSYTAHNVGDIYCIRNLAVDISNSLDIDEQSLYFFLEWVIDTFTKVAETSGRKYITIGTELSHCTEWFVEHGYSIRSNKNGIYRAIKTLQQEKCE